jgi:hypothetical protein
MISGALMPNPSQQLSPLGPGVPDVDPSPFLNKALYPFHILEKAAILAADMFDGPPPGQDVTFIIRGFIPNPNDKGMRVASHKNSLMYSIMLAIPSNMICGYRVWNVSTALV